MTDNRPAPGPAGGWEIACDATLQAVVECAGCPELFRRSLTGTIGWQARNRTTIDRVLTTPSAALPWFAALLAVGAVVSVDGREVLVEAFLERRVKGALQTLRIPVLGRDGSPLRGICWGEARVARTPSDDPIVSAVAVVDLAGDTVNLARLALTGVWSRPVGLAGAAARLTGGHLTVGSIRDVAAAVETEVTPSGDFRGSAEYRRTMAGVMARRALEACLKGQPTIHSVEEASHGR